MKTNRVDRAFDDAVQRLGGIIDRHHLDIKDAADFLTKVGEWCQQGGDGRAWIPAEKNEKDQPGWDEV